MCIFICVLRGLCIGVFSDISKCVYKYAFYLFIVVIMECSVFIPGFSTLKTQTCHTTLFVCR